MDKTLGSFFFSICFLVITILPSLSILIDEKVDVIQWVDSADDDEKTQEKNFEKDIVISNPFIEAPFYSASEDSYILAFQNFKYSKPHLNIVSPPPERFLT